MNDPLDLIVEDSLQIINSVDLSKLAGQSILLTGASGLLGVYFTSTVIQHNNNSKTPIKLFAVINSEISSEFVGLFKNENVTLIKGDLTNINFVESLPTVDNIIHAAGYGQPRRFMEDPIKTLKMSTTVTLLLFERLKSDGKFLFLSTSEVYSGLDSINYKESEIGRTNTTHYRSCYIEGKRSGEAICYAYRTMGYDTKSARLSLAYGPGTRKNDKRVINNFIEKAIMGKITMLDQGLAERTYCYIQDAVEMMWNIFLFGENPIYNIGGKSDTTIIELANKIAKITNVSVEVLTDEDDYQKGAPKNVSLDISLFDDEFNKKDFVTLDKGLKRTIEWQKYIYK